MVTVGDVRRLEDELKDCVQNGVEWLNDNEPGWVQSVDLQTLDMGSAYNCVAGQVFGDDDTCGYDVASGMLDTDVLGFSVGYDMTNSFGEEDVAYSMLTSMWTEVITELGGE